MCYQGTSVLRLCWILTGQAGIYLFSTLSISTERILLTGFFSPLFTSIWSHITVRQQVMIKLDTHFTEITEVVFTNQSSASITKQLNKKTPWIDVKKFKLCTSKSMLASGKKYL